MIRDIHTAAADGGADAKTNAKQELYDRLELIEITRARANEFGRDLVGRDEVHSKGVDTFGNLVRFRLGGPAFDRTCFAVRDRQTGALESAIYVYRMFQPLDGNPENLHGNVRSILNTQAQFRGPGDDPAANIFYSITRLGNLRGAGEVLIHKVYDHERALHPRAVLSTLSPLRQPEKGYGIDDFVAETTKTTWDDMDREEQVSFALRFLMQKKNGVQNFHMGNGAIVGDIKTDADSVGQKRLMVNYVYSRDPEVLQANSVAYRNADGMGVLELCVPHLVELLTGERAPEAGVEPWVPPFRPAVS